MHFGLSASEGRCQKTQRRDRTELRAMRGLQRRCRAELVIASDDVVLTWRCETITERHIAATPDGPPSEEPIRF